jgi:O-antigen biosynthesis protein
VLNQILKIEGILYGHAPFVEKCKRIKALAARKLGAKAEPSKSAPLGFVPASHTAWPTELPLVSIIVPCYNYGHFIEQALRSIYNQTFQNFEIIVVDCSDDFKSREIILSLAHPKLRVLLREERHLLGANRNFGIQHARGKYVCCLDPDDLFEPTYLEKALFVLETTEADICAPSVKTFGLSSHIWRLKFRPELKEQIDFNKISVVAVYRKTIWEKAKGFFDFGLGSKHIPEDWDFWVRAMALGARVRNITEPLMLYRRHNESMSAHPEIPEKDRQREAIRHHNKRFLGKWANRRSHLVQSLEYYPKDPNNSVLTSIRDAEAPRVLFALPFLVVGGSQQRHLKIGQHLKKQGFKITVLTTIEPAAFQGDSSSAFAQLTDEIYPLPNLLERIEMWKLFVFHLIKSRNINRLLIGNSQYIYDLLPELKKEFPNLKIIDQHFNTEGHTHNFKKYNQFIDHTVAENELVYEYLRKTHNLPTQRISLIHNGIEIEKNSAAARANNSAPSLKSEGQLLVAYIGRLSHEKGPDLFVEIARQLSQDFKFKFVLAGPGPMLPSLERLVNDAQLSHRLDLPGNINTPDIMQQADILVVPSRIDGRPNIILEAMAAGVPVIAAEVGGISSMIQHEKNGLLCNAESVDEFVDAIKRLADCPNLRNQLVEQASEYILTKANDAILLKQFDPIFKDPLSHAME